VAEIKVDPIEVEVEPEEVGLDPHRLDFPGRQRLDIDRGRPIREILA
jgi:hypothetical protein